MNEYHAVAQALAADAKRSLAAKMAELRAIPIGEKRLDIDFYNEKERERPVTAYDFKLGNQHYKGRASLWCVVFVKWTGDRWQRYKRMTGPMDYSDALTRLVKECKRRDMKRA
jgi:hypothetical protein